MGRGIKSRPGVYMVALATVLLGAAGIMAMPPAAAVSVQASSQRPSAGTSLESEFYGVSCSSASACTAVGDEETSTGTTATLVERWNGTSWSVQSAPAPSGAAAGYFDAVSCSSASACTAVGHYVAGTGGSVTLAERWNGTSWSVQSTPNPSGATLSTLNAVSCSSASACTAAGYFLTSGGTYQPLAETWNGTTWTAQSVPTPSGATAGFLLGVSCIAASACIATGYYSTGATDVALAETWNGAAWTAQPAATPSGAISTELYGVSCTSASACTAAGNYETSAGVTATLAERSDGSAWTVQSTPTPSSAIAGFLSGVSCTSASACTATGWYETTPGAYETLAEHWDGSAWSIQPTSNPSGAPDNYLLGVSCTSASACTAAGYDLNSTYTALAQGWNGTTWAIQSTPRP